MMSSMKALGSGSKCPERLPGVLRLYSNRFCPYAKRTRLLLEYKDIPYEVININLSDKPKWYIDTVNYLGMVPALETDAGIVCDSTIINEYLDRVYEDKKLLPTDPLQAAKDKMLAEVWSKVLRQCGRMYMCPAGKEVEIIPDLLEALDNIEKELKSRQGPFIGGNTPAMVDFHIWPHMERIFHYSEMFDDCKLPSTRFNRLNVWASTISELPVVTQTKTPLVSFRSFMNAVKAGKPNYDFGLVE